MRPKYLIGIHGQFDQAKFERDWRPWFTGVEVSSLSSWAEVAKTVAFVKERGIEFGIHFPLVKGRYGELDPHPLISSFDLGVRSASLQAVRTALREAKDLGAQYLLIHFPKPAIIQSDLDWSDWRFVQKGEAITDEHLVPTEVERAANVSFAQLDKLSQEAGVRLVLEMDILHAWFYQGLIRRLYESHSGLGLCLDTGRLHLQHATDPSFDIVAFVRLLSPWLTNLHLWTVCIGHNKKGGHHPLLPELSVEDGWGPMAELLEAAATAHEAYVLFEHRSDLISADDLERCYQWIASSLCPR